ncbi:MAG: hypothetical protein PUI81_09500, partial [Veillonellaceae bacterium]|nr:hypothetical protein [Veillonellaceae bacterium]
MSDKAEIFRAYNANERSAADSTQAGKTLGYSNSAVAILTDEAQIAKEGVYGRVEGVDKEDGTKSNAVGGLVGTMEGGSIDNAYNAGDVSGTNSVGGIVGKMTTGTMPDGTATEGTIEKAYNADNNTILLSKSGADGSHKTAADREAEGEYVGFTVTEGLDYDGDTTKTAPEGRTFRVYNDQDNVQHDADINGTYTYDVIDGTWTRTSADGTVTKGILTDYLPSSWLRLNNNRMAYRDARVTGSGENVGGIVGTMEGGTINQAYNEGRVTGSSTDGGKTTGGIAGLYTGGTLGSDPESKLLYSTKDEALPQEKANISNGNAYDISTVGSSSTKTDGNMKGLTLNQMTDSSEIGWKDSNNTVMDEDNAQNDDWIAYNNQTAPLLKTFMNFISIKRQYQYDGTVHNLITSDVKNYYGGAFFDNSHGEGYGKNVHTKDIDVVTGYNPDDWQIGSGSKDADTEHSSLYSYDKSDLWSPQHGYYTKGDASLIITPEPVQIAIRDVVKKYGQLTKGYVFFDGKTYYTYNAPKDGAEKGTWTASDKAPLEGTKYIITMTHAETDKKTGEVSFVEGLSNENDSAGINPTTQLHELPFLKADILNPDGTPSTRTTSGAENFAVTEDEIENRKQMPGSSYKLRLTGVEGDKTEGEYREAENYNYKIDYSVVKDEEKVKEAQQAELDVVKADLYFTAEGSRDYGDDNTLGTVTLSVGVNAKDEDDQNTGRLKSWDAAPEAEYKDKNGNGTGRYDFTQLDLKNYVGPKDKDKDTVVLVTGDTAKNGIKDDQSGKPIDENNPVIDAKTWVKGTAQAPEAYTIGKGSFMVNGESQFLSDKYNIIYTGNKDDAKDTGFGGYTIKPIPITYKITGHHVYGEKPQGSYEMTAIPLKNDDKIENVVNEGNAEDLVNQTIIDHKINEETHVARDKDGKVTSVYDEGTVFGKDTAEGKISNASSLTTNYILQSGELYYRVDPAKGVFTVNDNEKTYGDTTLTNPYSGKLELTKGDVKTTYDVDKDGNVTLKQADGTIAKVTNKDGALTDPVGEAELYEGSEKKNDTIATFTPIADKAGNDPLDPKLKVKYAADGNTVDTYGGMISAGGLWLNDYDIKTYNPGGVKVNPKELTVTAGTASKVYGDENTKDSVTFGKVTFGDQFIDDSEKALLGGDKGAAYFGTKLTDAAKTITNTTNAGEKLDGATEVVDNTGATTLADSPYSNYKLVTKTGTEHVTKRLLDYQVDDTTSVYGSTPVFSGTFTNFANGDDKNGAPEVAQDTYTVSQKEGSDEKPKDKINQSNVGSYAIGATDAGLKKSLETWTNYDLGKVTGGTWTVDKARLDITADGSREYGTENTYGSITGLRTIKNNADTSTDGTDDGALKSWDVLDTDNADITKLL